MCVLLRSLPRIRRTRWGSTRLGLVHEVRIDPASRVHLKIECTHMIRRASSIERVLAVVVLAADEARPVRQDAHVRRAPPEERRTTLRAQEVEPQEERDLGSRLKRTVEELLGETRMSAVKCLLRKKRAREARLRSVAHSFPVATMSA